MFDEVDAGIGGTAAVAVAEALSALGADHQVLVVTHLPQVAALARAQVVVSKEVRDGQTFASVGALDGERRVDELARMLSGSTDEAALEHARELLAARLIHARPARVGVWWDPVVHPLERVV